jgi:putative ABC transport system permease protein
MNLRESILQSVDNLAKRKLRSLLTMFGIIFGVGAVISMLSIGAGAEEESLKLIRQMGLRNILVAGKEYTQEDLRKVREQSLGLSLRDLDALKEVIPNLTGGVGLKRIKAYQVFSGNVRVNSGVVAVGPDYFSIGTLHLVEGAFFDEQDEAIYEQVCVLGSGVKEQLFGFGDAVGRTVKIDNTWFSIVGVIADQALSQDEFEGVKLQNSNNDIYIPLSTALKKLEMRALESELDEIVLEVSNEKECQITALLVSQMLEKLHNGEMDYNLVVPEKLLRQSRQTHVIFSIVMGCIASISLLVGGIGIMNIMLANVLERTHEIGIRRAIGATRRDIQAQFLLEAVTISGVGGILGIGLGFAISQTVNFYAGWNTVITGWSVMLAFGVSTAIGIMFGFYPATQAARLDPIEALRYE